MRIEDAKTYDAGTYTCRLVRICSAYTCVQFWSLKISGQFFLYVAWVISMGTEVNLKNTNLHLAFNKILSVF